MTVLIPSYRRHHDLGRCLSALRAQTHAPEAVLVALRRDDEESRGLVRHLASAWSALSAVLVDQPGVVAAMNAGLAEAQGDILAITDDDAEPLADWVARLVETFVSDAAIGGVGGRDQQVNVPAECRTVGHVQWMGRVVGNHHVGDGPPRDVDVLKGANCAFRLPVIRAIGFDERLRGDGAQVHWEMSLCLSIRRKGWRLRYDPAILVRHHVGIRHGDDQRHRGPFSPRAHSAAVFNETLALAEHLRGVRRIAFAWWSVVVGTAEAPGILQLPRVFAHEGRSAVTRWTVTQRARREGVAAARTDAP